ncbi:hypothetical protein [Ruminococcus flavefaciens]|nr:hypothetical protein [Ruminococcus flavefaciens]
MKRDTLCGKGIVKHYILMLLLLHFNRQFSSGLVNGFRQRAVV